MKKTVKNNKAEIFIPRDMGSKNDSDLFVSVNGRHFTIKRGIKVSVPLEVKEVIEASLRSDEEAYRFIKGNASV